MHPLPYDDDKDRPQIRVVQRAKKNSLHNDRKRNCTHRRENSFRR